MRCLILKSFVSRSISPTLSLAPLVNGWMVMMMRSMCFMSSLVLEVINVKWSLNIIVFRHCLMVCIVCPRFFGPIVKVGVSVTRYEDTPPRPRIIVYKRKRSLISSVSCTIRFITRSIRFMM